MRLPVSPWLYGVLRVLGCPVAWDVSAGAVVFRRTLNNEREYLLLHYPSGHFDFAKGHIEPGETEEQAARRETEEEAGIADLTIFPHRMSIRYFYVAGTQEAERRRRSGRGTWIFKTVAFYPAETKTSDVTLSHEHIGSLWLPYAEAMEKVTFDNARRVLRETEGWLRRKR